MEKILVFDTTLRDGEQSPGATMTTAEKVRVAQELDALGVDIIEAGFPVSSPQEFDSVVQVAKSVERPIVATPKGVRLCRPSEAVHDLLDKPPEGVVKEDGEVVKA